MTKLEIEKHAAVMRCRSFERRRRRVFSNISRQFMAGTISATEAQALKRRFWDQGAKDVLIARGARNTDAFRLQVPPI